MAGLAPQPNLVVLPDGVERLDVCGSSHNGPGGASRGVVAAARAAAAGSGACACPASGSGVSCRERLYRGDPTAHPGLSGTGFFVHDDPARGPLMASWNVLTNMASRNGQLRSRRVDLAYRIPGAAVLQPGYAAGLALRSGRRRYRVGRKQHAAFGARAAGDQKLWPSKVSRNRTISGTCLTIQWMAPLWPMMPLQSIGTMSWKGRACSNTPTAIAFCAG